MKSKFMRMVGSGVEDPEEEEQVEEVQMEEEQNKVLPQISDAEIDGFYEKFLTTGFPSPYILDKRRYVLDIYLQIEKFLVLNEEEKVGGAKKRLVGGKSTFDTILRTIKYQSDYEPFLRYDKVLDDYTSDDIDELISNMTYAKMMAENIDENLFDFQTQFKKDFEKQFETQLNSLQRDKTQYIDDISYFINQLQNAKITDVSPQEDILDERRFKILEQEEGPFGLKDVLPGGKYEYITPEIEQQFQEESDIFFETYKVPRSSIIKLKEIEKDIGIGIDVTSSNVLRSLQNFEDRTQIRESVKDLIYIIEEAKNNNEITPAYIDFLKKRGVTVSDKLEKQMLSYVKPVEFKTDAEKKAILEKVEIAKSKVKKDENWYKVVMKELFINSLKYKMIGKNYVDEEGDLYLEPETRKIIYENKEQFVNKSPFKAPRYKYDEIKELGNLYEYFEALRYGSNIAFLVGKDFYENTKNEDLAREAANAVNKWFRNNAKSLRIVYGYYTADVDRIDNVITFKSKTDGEDYTINIETKFSGNTTQSPMKTLQQNTAYPFVYTGLTKILYLIKNYFDGIEYENNIPKKKTVYSYNNLYYKNDTDIFGKVMSKQKFNIKPTSATMLSIEKLVSVLGITPTDVENLSTGSTQGRPKKSTSIEEEEDENKKQKNLKKIMELLNNKFVDALVKLKSSKLDLDEEDIKIVSQSLKEKITLKKLDIKEKSKELLIKGLISDLKNKGVNRVQENIYIDIPTLYALGVAYDLELNPSITNTFKFKGIPQDVTTKKTEKLTDVFDTFKFQNTKKIYTDKMKQLTKIFDEKIDNDNELTEEEFEVYRNVIKSRDIPTNPIDLEYSEEEEDSEMPPQKTPQKTKKQLKEEETPSPMKRAMKPQKNVFTQYYQRKNPQQQQQQKQKPPKSVSKSVSNIMYALAGFNSPYEE